MLLSRPIFIIAISIFLAIPLCGEAQPDTISIGAISKIYEPLKFTHDKHMEIESNCSACHHHSEQGATPTCASCHSDGDKVAKKRNIIGLKDAYHGLCIGCHKKISGPSGCTGCHNKKNRKLDTISLKTISNIYLPVTFSHGKHIDTISDCASCHHHSEGNSTPACNVCHETATIYKYKGPDRKTALGLKGAYHVLCVGCHKKGNGPTKCGECHIRKARKQ